MEPDYNGEVRRCLTSVVFVPFTIAERIQNNILERLREIAPTHYYYPPDTLHITIKNIRTVHAPPLFTNTDIETCRSVFSEVSARHAPFSFELRHVAVFSTSVCVIGFCDERLKDLVVDLDRELQHAGVPDNKNYISDSVFFGNVTVCRFTAPPSERLLQAARELRTAVNELVPVHAVNLITCDSVCSRSSRTLIDSFQLSDGRTTTKNQPFEG
jgi:2'-5' RNA ligase